MSLEVLLIGQTRRWSSPDNFRWLADTERAVRALGQRAVACAYRESWAASPTLARALRWWPPARRAADATAARQTFHAAVQRRARETRPDVTIVLKPDLLDGPTLHTLKRHTAGPVTAWWVDDPWRFPDGLAHLPLFDHLFVFDRAYLGRLEAAGGRRVHFLPCACDETLYRPMPLGGSDRRRFGCDVSFVAWCYPERQALVRRLARAAELAVWGGGWEPLAATCTPSGAPAIRGPAIAAADAAKVYNASKIGLNIHARQTQDGGLNTRTFELLACGTFQLIDRVRGVEELLQPDREVVCYGDAEEAVALTARYLRDPDERRRIAERGRARVLDQHTYRHRLATLLERARA